MSSSKGNIGGGKSPREPAPKRELQLLEKVTRRNEELHAANVLNESIIESINQALVVLDTSFRIVRCNQRFREIFRIESGDVGNAPLAVVFGNKKLENIIRRGLRKGESMREVEFQSPASGGETRHFLLAISRIEHPPADQNILVCFDEITEWKRRQSQVMEASRLVSIGEMVAGIAHEINNPMAAIMGYAQLVLRRDVEPGVRRDLEKILAEAQRTSKIIANLQSFARKNPPRKSHVNMARIIRNVLDFRAYELRVNNIEVIAKLEPDTAVVLGDESQLEQVFVNIITNAEEFMTEAHGRGTLTVELTTEGGKARASFADDGPGISKEDMTKAFDPFFTTKEVGKGSGLGLSTCYGIIKEHDGTITVESDPGRGATFIIELPLADRQATTPSQNRSAGASFGLQSMNILVVDDEPAVADVLWRALSEGGHCVEVAKDGEAAIQDKRLTTYDLVILDMKMPGLSGAELYTHINRLSEEASSKVLFITGDNTNPATTDFISRTGSPILTKPFTLENLLVAVDQFSLTRGWQCGPGS